MAPRRREGRRQLRRLAVLVGCGVALGVLSAQGADLPGALRALPDLGTPWLVLAFVAGRGARDVRRAALTAVAVVEAGLVTYYLWQATLGAGGSMLADYGAPVWLVSGALLGGLFGGAGWLGEHSESGPVRLLAWAVLAGVPVAEIPHARASGVDHRNLVILALVATSVALVVWATARGRVATHVLVPVATGLGLLGYGVHEALLSFR
ncbi:DUF6518 family protein [Nocardioides sp. YIM 152315]|uniref:DUF6518 family protein n=1 Tax=Nocardioides sp. YIM 152315 TaxID=3031760 RepID=UPI0023DB29C6|nr:DUF6518 family protein [Nocardioides sp. YIM 152315]MDF1602920.1 DUF6518 family protein [Nocardioides sp. YIM 152315]